MNSRTTTTPLTSQAARSESSGAWACTRASASTAAEAVSLEAVSSAWSARCRLAHSRPARSLSGCRAHRLAETRAAVARRAGLHQPPGALAQPPAGAVQGLLQRHADVESGAQLGGGQPLPGAGRQPAQRGL